MFEMYENALFKYLDRRTRLIHMGNGGLHPPQVLFIVVDSIKSFVLAKKPILGEYTIVLPPDKNFFTRADLENPAYYFTSQQEPYGSLYSKGDFHPKVEGFRLEDDPTELYLDPHGRLHLNPQQR